MKIWSLFFILLVGFISQAQTVILQTDFQSGIPSNYSQLNLDGALPHPNVAEYANGWIVVSDPENPTDSVVGVSSYFQTPDTANRWLITPQLTLGSFGNYLSWEAKSHDPSFPDDYLVLLSTTTNDPSSFIDTIGSVQEENFEWTTREVNLSEEGYNDSLIYIAFVLRTFDGFKLYLDDITVRKDVPVGFAESTKHNWRIYPNPSQAQINFESNEEFHYLTINNFNGKELLRSNQSTVNIEFLLPGAYLIRCKTNLGMYTQRIVKI